jgi:hypothetical protein
MTSLARSCIGGFSFPNSSSKLVWKPGIPFFLSLICFHSQAFPYCSTLALPDFLCHWTNSKCFVFQSTNVKLIIAFRLTSSKTQGNLSCSQCRWIPKVPTPVSHFRVICCGENQYTNGRNSSWMNVTFSYLYYSHTLRSFIFTDFNSWYNEFPFKIWNFFHAIALEIFFFLNDHYC